MDLQGGIFAGILAIFGAIAAVFRMREERAKRQVEMSAQLQQAMVDRVLRLETWSHAQDDKIDKLQEQLAQARTENAELKWKYADLWEDHTKLARRCEDLENSLREMYRSVSGKSVTPIRKKGPENEPR